MTTIAEKLTTIAENTPKVYKAGESKGYADGYSKGVTDGEKTGHDVGFAEGKENEWHRFWHSYQQYGDRNISPQGLFSGNGFRDSIFKPLYDIPIGRGTFEASTIQNLKQCLLDAGVSCFIKEPLNHTFNWSWVAHVPDLSGTELTEELNNTFSWCNKLHTIDGIKTTDTVKFTQTFVSSPNLANVRFSGTIGQNIDFSDNPLTPASMKSVISCLKDYANTENDGKYTVSFSDACWTALAQTGEWPPIPVSWKEYVMVYLGWNV